VKLVRRCARRHAKQPGGRGNMEIKIESEVFIVPVRVAPYKIKLTV
jgi:hypothetical protein